MPIVNIGREGAIVQAVTQGHMALSCSNCQRYMLRRIARLLKCDGCSWSTEIQVDKTLSA